MIRVLDLDFGYGDVGFRMQIPRLEIDRGETTAVIGPSGSGKTTLLNLVAGIVVPDRGRIESVGICVSDLSDGRRREFRIANVGLVFQEFELLAYLSVLDNILLPYRINRALRLTGTVRRRAVALAQQVGVADKLGRYPRQLSHGERQRVAVCRAVLAEPQLVLADEPTGNLDPVNAERVLELLFEYARSSGATLLTVTHDHGLLGRFQNVIDFDSIGGARAAAS
jgi:putative ABC transport system ATP-binding protein